MTRLVALRDASRSLSHWGLFEFPCERVEIEWTDLGRNPVSGDYVTEFRAEGRRVTSGFDAATLDPRSLIKSRTEADIQALQLAFGIDPSTVQVLE